MSSPYEVSAAPPPYNQKSDPSSSTMYYQQVQSPTPTIQQSQSAYVSGPITVAYGDVPVSCNCPHCHQSIITRVEKTNGLIVWLSAGVLCLFGCFLGCCLIPFCIDDLKDTKHYCPNCHRVVGWQKKL